MNENSELIKPPSYYEKKIEEIQSPKYANNSSVYESGYEKSGLSSNKSAIHEFEIKELERNEEMEHQIKQQAK